MTQTASHVGQSPSFCSGVPWVEPVGASVLRTCVSHADVMDSHTGTFQAGMGLPLEIAF